jgi:YNFM family putative membrane transporter
MAHISSQFQGAELQRAMAAYVGTTILGGLCGRIISAALATWFGWRWAMLLIALAMLPGILVVTGFSGETRVRFTRTRWASFAQVFKNSVLVRLLCFEAGGLFVFTAIGNCLPFYLNSLNAEISELRVALMYSGYGLGALIAFSSGRLTALFGGEARALLLTFCAYFALMPGFAGTDMRVIFLAMTLFCGTQFMQHSICPGLINRLSESERGVTNGICLACYYTGGALGSYLSVLVYVHFSWTACVVMLMTLLFAMICVAFSLRAQLPRS